MQLQRIWGMHTEEMYIVASAARSAIIVEVLNEDFHWQYMDEGVVWKFLKYILMSIILAINFGYASCSPIIGI